MKKVFNIILTILTIALLALVTFNKLNQTANWVDLSAYQEIINFLWQFGPIVIMTLFAFGTFIAKMLVYKILFVFVALLLAAFTIAMVAPELIANLF